MHAPAFHSLDPLTVTLFLVFAAVTLALVCVGLGAPLLLLVRALAERRRRRRGGEPARE